MCAVEGGDPITTGGRHGLACADKYSSGSSGLHSGSDVNRYHHEIASLATPYARARYSRNELEVVMDQTARELQHFASFHGFAIRSYESYRPWLERSR